MMKALHRQLLVAGLVGSLGLAAMAQAPAPAPATTPPAGTAPAQPMMRGEPGRMDAQRMERFRAHAEERRASRLAELKAQLRVTAAQEGAWTTWTGAMRPPAAGQFQRPRRAELLALTTPERIDRMRQLRTQRSAEMDRRGEATKAFYGALTQEQKRVFDAVGMRYARGGMGEKGGRGGMGGHGRHHRG
jgi:periplasmic protein CpxP/Spy